MAVTADIGLTVSDLTPLFSGGSASDSHAYGVVESVNADGSYGVRIDASTAVTRCTACHSASAGDRVLVLVKADGSCDVVGRVGGEGGGSGGSGAYVAGEGITISGLVISAEVTDEDVEPIPSSWIENLD